MAQLTHSWQDLIRFRGFGDGGREIASEVRLNCPEWTGTDLYGTTCNIAQATTDSDFIEGLIRKDVTKIDPFRNTNEGVAMTVGKYERTMFKLHNATGFIRIDRSLVYRNPAEGARYMKLEGTRILEGIIKGMGCQFFYGGTAKASANGFDGLQTFVDLEMSVNAGGSAAQSGDTGLTSCYLVRFSEIDGVSWLLGKGGIFELSDPRETTIIDPNNSSKTVPVIEQVLEFYPGFAFNTKYAAARIANIGVSTATTPASISKTAFTDNHLLVAVEKLKGAAPDAIFMPRRAGILLAASRQPSITIKDTSIATGTMNVPRDWEGIPILYTDSLDYNEAAVSFS